ncbi:MAG: hypothetical protein LUI07_02520 [Lachnospiraceae bacterium]|nr:hypothetical protein [Lachnospiraceae bacterium]
MELTDYTIGKEYERSIGFSSIGVQTKYYKDGYWYKKNSCGYEGTAEKVCSDVLGFTNIRDYVPYETCRINGISGCRSKNFLNPEQETFTSFAAAYRFAYGADLTNKIYTCQEPRDRIQFVVDFIYGFAGLDCTEYLRTLLSFDMLVLNIDRHFHNMGLIKSEAGYRFAPIFDNGAALLSNMTVFPPDELIEDNIEAAVSKPFCGSFERQALVLGTNIEIDYTGLMAYIETIPHTRAREVLCLQVKRYRKFFPEMKDIPYIKRNPE